MSKSRKSYQLPRTLLSIGIPWFLVGTLPRQLGIAVTPQKYVTAIRIADTLMTIELLVGLGILYYYLVSNAKLRQAKQD
jgi:hypothetical protein